MGDNTKTFQAVCKHYKLEATVLYFSALDFSITHSFLTEPLCREQMIDDTKPILTKYPSESARYQPVIKFLDPIFHAHLTHGGNGNNRRQETQSSFGYTIYRF